MKLTRGQTALRNAQGGGSSLPTAVPAPSTTAIDVATTMRLMITPRPYPDVTGNTTSPIGGVTRSATTR
jgi:hypothetical protein